MKRTLILAIALLVGVGPVLAGCGGSAPTETPAPAPTSTSLPPSPPPPTSTAVPPTPTVGARPATAADLALIQEALITTAALKSFHLTQAVGGSIAPQARDVEGDYVAPGRLYAKGRAGDEQGSFLKAGTRNYKQDAAGNWVPWTDPSEKQPQTPQELMSSIFTGLAQIAAISTFQNAGAPEMVDGVSTQHFVGTIPIDKMPGIPEAIAAVPDLPPVGTIAFWIDPVAKIVYKLEVHVDTGPAMAAATARLATPGVPTAVPAPADVLTMQMAISRPNDPAIQVPAPPCGTPSTAATATTAGTNAGPIDTGPTPTAVSMPLDACAGHHTPQTALVLPGPAHVDLTLTSPQDVVYFSFKTGSPASVGLWFYNPDDAVGQLKVQLLDAGEQKELNVDTLKPGDQSSLSMALPTPGVYLIKVTAAGLTRVPQTPVQVELNSLDILRP